MSDSTLIKTPLLLIIDTFVVLAQLFGPHPAHLFGTVESMFFKIGVYLVITQCRKNKWNITFLVWYAEVAVCSHFLVVSVSLLVFCSCLCVVCVVYVHLLLVCGCLWLFVVVVSFSNYEHVNHLREKHLRASTQLNWTTKT